MITTAQANTTGRNIILLTEILSPIYTEDSLDLLKEPVNGCCDGYRLGGIGGERKGRVDRGGLTRLFSYTNIYYILFSVKLNG
jgi:hypothetical protein